MNVKELKEFISKYQGQTPKPMLCDESCEYHCTENGAKPASCKKTPQDKIIGQFNVINLANEMFAPKSTGVAQKVDSVTVAVDFKEPETKEQALYQIQVLENGMKDLLMRRNNIKSKLDSYA